MKNLRLTRKRHRNELKLRVLSVLENRGWLSTPMIRHLASGPLFRPKLNYSLERYRKYGLVKRAGRWNAKPVLYRITAEGLKKLAWLRSQRTQ